MENLSMIAAIGKNNELGLDNHLIWKIPEDLNFYKMMTLHKNIIMGRKTLESLPRISLINRTPFVLSTRKLDNYLDVFNFDELDMLLSFIDNNYDEEFMVVGGESIYRQFLPYANAIYLTEINDEAKADTFFPAFDKNAFTSVQLGDYTYNGLDYKRKKYIRKK